MPEIIRHSLIIFSLIIGLAVNLYAIDETTNTLVTKEGERLENVVFKINYNFAVINIEKLNRNISFHNIDTIYSANGLDITRFILDADGNNLPKGRHLKWRFGFMGSINTSLPGGSYYDRAIRLDVGQFGPPKAGIGYDASLLVNISETFVLCFTFSKCGMYLSDQWDPLELDVWKYRLSIIHYPFYGASQDITNNVFYSFGLGIVDHVSSLNDYTVDGTKFAITLGGGGGITITKFMVFYCSIDADIFFAENIYRANTLSTITNLKAGIQFRL